jgi:dienelactone hydrolase
MQRISLIALAVFGACAPPPLAPPPSVADPVAEDAPVIVDPACTANGCLRALTDLGSFVRADIEPFLLAGVSITNGYRVLTIEYATGLRSSTATVTLPIDLVDDAPADGFPVVVNAHGTIGIEDPCRISGTISGTGLAGLFGGRGAIGVAPDYPGLGTAGLHPYLDAHSEGESVLDGIRAALLLARHEGVSASGRSAVVGLSQGGHASLAAAALHDSYAPELDIRAFAASAPANLYAEQWAPGILIAGPHISTFALLAYSWAAQSGVDDGLLWAPGIDGDIDALMASRCEWSPSFTIEPLLGDALSDTPSEVFSQAFLDAFSTGAWGDDFAFMGELFERNRVVPFAQTAPIHIWQGTADAVVLPAMTQELVADLEAGGMDVELTLVEGGTHIDTAFGFLAFPERATADSVAWVQAQLAAP